ncbi:acyl-CoA thioesterase [Truepera radiovictrix]|uniref:Thioesterase superfamily protein n=1 Tax=Truepera radiovictrix (strain DSM 17093 / CIP 108686 / LMG 22925 / RQ-24) TaxID=649638 RepID=D7CY13_TRURR|nr:thioesterase family protein [Truepera radiovictrix]ADI13373.1 thioesterase superfamily protein [Truepera radiovictrix DSM 17093]WMT58064.1 thioesterase family protein [Truepera radiovictrix]
MPHRTDIQVRFSDTDAQGHLNNTAYAVYAELARADLLDALRGPDTYLLLAEMTLRFQSQVRFGQAVHVTTDVQEVGESSVTLEQTVYADDEAAATVTSVVVLFDARAQAPKAFPERVRKRLEAGEPLG